MVEVAPEFEMKDDTGNPLDTEIKGRDSTDTLRTLLTDSEGRLITTSELLSPLPSFQFTSRRVIGSLATVYTTKLITARTAMKQFTLGGRAACESQLGKYVASTTALTGNGTGGFNSTSDVSAWTNSGIGANAANTWTYATDQFFAGTGSAKQTFTASANNDYPEITYTYSTPQDLSVWKEISARVRVTVAAGGNQTRTVSIRLRSGTAIAIWQVVGSTTTSPFNVEQWVQVFGDLTAPHATAGTGTFDLNNVDSISLRLQDGGNKAGTIWWDDVRFNGSISNIVKIYTAAGTTVNDLFDPVVIFEANETAIVVTRNNSAGAAEIQTYLAGVSI